MNVRRAAKTDGNHADVLKALRDAGATAQSLHTVGQGCPDILVGFRGINILLEVKDGSLTSSRRELTADEREWHGTWGGQVAVAKTPEEAVCAVVEAAKRCGVL